MKLYSLVNLAPSRPLHWAVTRCHLAVTGRLPPQVPVHRQPRLDPSSLRTEALWVVCVLLSVSINLKAPSGQAPPHCCAMVHHSQTYATIKHNTDEHHTDKHMKPLHTSTRTQTQTFYTPAHPQLSLITTKGKDLNNVQIMHAHS